MSFRVIFRPRARDDIAAATAWLAQGSPAAAARWRSGLFHIVEKLETNPTLYPGADEATDLGVDLRELLYGRRPRVYRILFTITGQTVNVLRVRHAAQDRLKPGDV
ncbi:MAG TPA: type II toxin-antitoxin system RelE/ParE family toxin [Gemmataceae bacterium]|nr:type II toxin-antitoxin system RelE/ParE family toxin [Gemmataceae bacterium]